MVRELFFWCSLSFYYQRVAEGARQLNFSNWNIPFFLAGLVEYYITNFSPHVEQILSRGESQEISKSPASFLSWRITIEAHQCTITGHRNEIADLTTIFTRAEGRATSILHASYFLTIRLLCVQPTAEEVFEIDPSSNKLRSITSPQPKPGVDPFRREWENLLAASDLRSCLAKSWCKVYSFDVHHLVVVKEWPNNARCLDIS